MDGEHIYKFTPTHYFIASKSDRSQLNIVAKLPIRKNETVYEIDEVTIINHPSQIQTKTTCPNTFVSYFCTVGSPQSHRLDNVYQLYFNSWSCGSGCWELSNTLDCRIVSEKRGFLGLWYRHITPITWGIGWGAQGDPAVTAYTSGGTGWTSSGVSEIHYSIAASIFYYLSTINYKYQYKFDYLYTNATTVEISSCSFGCQ